MAALSSSSTLVEVKAAYDDNASYEEDASVSKAKAFVTACRFLLRRLPKRSAGSAGSGEIELNSEQIERQLEEARKWVAANDTAPATSVGHTRHSSFRDFRE